MPEQTESNTISGSMPVFYFKVPKKSMENELRRLTIAGH
jgi:hypothetical protein